MELSRLLRRALLVGAIAAMGWLLSVVFAGSAAADNDPGVTEPATTETQQQSGGLLGGLLGGVTNTLTGLTNTVVQLTGAVLDTTTTILAPVVTPSPEPIIDLPALLPTQSHGSSGSAETDRGDVPPPAPVVVAPAPSPAPPAAQPVELAVVRPAEVPAPAPAPVAKEDNDGPADEHANRGGSDPQPVKAPATPAGPGSTASPAHDSFGGARGTYGVLTTQATLHPADAGFTTRSRAGNAAGRDTGLPATSPD